MSSINKDYQFDQFGISVELSEKMWRIPNTKAFASFIEQDKNHLNQLYDKLQHDYTTAFGKPIKISRNSFIVEIWAHVFVEQFMELGKRLRRFRLFEKLYEQVRKRTEIIDSGEAPLDKNRKIWDRLAKLFNPISGEKAALDTKKQYRATGGDS